jgi:hypothetical protein
MDGKYHRMEYLKELLYINDMDVFKEYGVFLTETEAGGHTNYDALLLPPKLKEYVVVDFREEDGEKLPDNLIPRYEARDVTLHFALRASNPIAWKTKYTAFLTLLKSGWLNIRVPELDKTYRMYVKEFSSYEQPTPFAGEIYCRFKVRFREPNPSF